ncbi:MAG: motility protein A, partial [bacterium]
MDISTLIGFIFGTGLIVWGMSQGGSGLLIYWNVPSLAIVVGGGTAAVMVCFPLNKVIGAMKVVKNAFIPQTKESTDIIGILVSFAE